MGASNKNAVLLSIIVLRVDRLACHTIGGDAIIYSNLISNDNRKLLWNPQVHIVEVEV